MAERLIKLYLPSGVAGPPQDLFPDDALLSTWEQQGRPGTVEYTFLVESGETGALLDRLEERFGTVDGFRVVILTVAASLPQLPEEEDEAEPDSGNPDAISRAELIEEVSRGARFSVPFVVMVVLATVVTIIGMLRNDVTTLIAAMVMAPLLGPNVALGLASTLADRKLGRLALETGIRGGLITLALAVPAGAVYSGSVLTAEMGARTRVDLSDLLVSLAAGVAAAMSLSTGIPAALIGVMVAVSILPPLVVAGMMAGSGHWAAFLGATLLFIANVACVNLAAVGTFLAQGVRPGGWLEARAARRLSRRALLVWLGLLALLVVVIVLADPNNNLRLALP